jgi:hypothetical protein
MMDITQDELRFIYQMGKEAGRQEVISGADKYEAELFEQLRYENRNFIDFIHFVKMHYPEAVVEWDAVNKVKES